MFFRKRGANVSIYAPEAAALALIVIGFKILFGLNDNREWGVPEPCNTHGITFYHILNSFFFNILNQ